MKKLIPADAVLVPEHAQRVFKGMIFDVYQWPQKLFDGSKHTFEMLKRTDTVTVICVMEGKILVIDDEQPHLGVRKSFPGGRVDATDPDVQTAAKREILEETGYKFQNWRLVKIKQPYRKIEWFVYVWLAWEAVDKQEPYLDAGEKIAVQQLDFAEVKALVMKDVDYLGGSRDLFTNLQNLNDLLALHEFTGRLVER